MSKKKLNCFIKQYRDENWKPAVRLSNGEFANSAGWVLTDPVEVRDATYEEIVTECAARGETVSDKIFGLGGRGPHY